MENRETKAGINKGNIDLSMSVRFEFLSDSLITRTNYQTNQIETTKTGNYFGSTTKQKQQTKARQVNIEGI